MKKFIVLSIFILLTLLTIVLVFAFKRANSVDIYFSVNETLDFSSEYDVKLDVDYLREHIVPAHE